MSSLHSQPEDLNPDAAGGELPERLIAEMRSTYGRTVSVPRAVDAEILKEARAGFARRRRFRIAVRGAIVTAAAAAVALAFMIPALMKPDAPPPQAGVTATTNMLMIATARGEDVDHNGKVDILDAFVVAKLIDVRGEINASYDVNGDGAIDQSDVDRIAMAAVETSREDEARVQ